MKNLKFTFLLALALIAFTASLRAEFLYVSYGKGLLSFSINAQTGVLTELPGTPTIFGEATGPLTLDHTGKLLYLSVGGSIFPDGITLDPFTSIHGYRIAGNGQLIPLPGSPYKVTGGGLAVDPYNRFLYATANNSIYVYRIEPNGSLRAAPDSPFPSSGAGSITVDPFGRFIYVLGSVNVGGFYGTATVSAYNVLAGGYLVPAPGSPVYTDHEFSVSVKAESSGRFIYVANNLESSIIVYQVAANGSLTQVPGSGMTVGGPWCEELAYSPVGNYLYFTIDDALIDYHINAVTDCRKQRYLRRVR
jgi:Lactonase, 7-bladed beta-propeller